MTRERVNTTLGIPKTTVPAENAIDVTSYSDGTDAISGGGTSLNVSMQKIGTSAQMVRTQMGAGWGDLNIYLRKLTGEDITPDMNPVITIYKVIWAPWGYAGHAEVHSTWSYNASAKAYMIKLSDGGLEPTGYSIIADLPDEWDAEETQAPNNIKDDIWTTSGGTPNFDLYMPSTDVIPVYIYCGGTYRFILGIDCQTAGATMTFAGVRRSDLTLVTYTADFEWKAPYWYIYLPWDEVANLDENGYWITYNAAGTFTHQYPRRYHATGDNQDWYQVGDLIPPGTYSDMLVYLSFDYEWQGTPTPYTSLTQVGTTACHTVDPGGGYVDGVSGLDYTPSYPGHPGGTWEYLFFEPDGGPYYCFLNVKCSVPYSVRYHAPEVLISVGTFEKSTAWGCDQPHGTCYITTDSVLAFTAYNNSVVPVGGTIEYSGSCSWRQHYTAMHFRAVDNVGMKFAVSNVYAGRMTLTLL